MLVMEVRLSGAPVEGVTVDPPHGGILHAPGQSYIPFRHLRVSNTPIARTATHPGAQVALVMIAGFESDDQVTVNSIDCPFNVLMVAPGGPTSIEVEADNRQFRVSGYGTRVSWHPPGHDYTARFPADARSLNLIMPPGRITGLLDLEMQQRIEPVTYVVDDQISTLARLAASEIENPGFSSDLLIDGALRAVAALLVRHDGHAARQRSERICLPPAKLRRVIDYIEAHLAEALTIDDLANSIGLSAFHFSRVFKRSTGVSPYQFVQERRLYRARQLLQHGSMEIAEIAKCCGFADQAHFTHAFGKRMGISPARFRREISS
jgi:AraC family transcriptional regulator